MTAASGTFLALVLLLWLIDPKLDGNYELLLYTIAIVSYSVIGGFVASRRPENPIGWLMCLSGLAVAISGAGEGYVRYALLHHDGTLPGGPAAAWVSNMMGSLFFFLALTYILQLFPTGKVLSERWRPVLWVTTTSLGILMLGVAFLPGPIEDLPFVDNPLGLSGVGGDIARAAEPVGWMMTIACLLLSVASAALRWRRSRGEERQQLKWLAAAGVALLFTMAAVFPSEMWNLLVIPLALVPVAVGIAILKYRLYDIDVVITKTLVFGALAAFITVIYVAIVVGIGTALGSSDKPNLGLSIVATAIVAIAFQPVKARVETLANRIVYGKRQTPYQILGEFSDKVATSYETQEVTPAMARVLKDASAAERAEVWLAVDGSLIRTASFPEDPHTVEPIQLDGAHIPTLHDLDHAVPVVHQDEILGALGIAKSKSDPLNSADVKLLDDLASQAGIVLRNSRLTVELQARLDQISAQAEEITRSRQRIVSAQDKERRRLERDIHDGAQQHLVALAVKLRLAKTMTERKPERATTMLQELKTEMQDALDTLADLARGIYPPLLKDKGIASALTARVEKVPFEVSIEDHTSSRFDPAIEAATYFCCLEALQNTAKYADATKTTITLDDHNSELVFSVADDGLGFDPAITSPGSGLTGIADRLAALEGTIEVISAPGRGTRITGLVPIEPGGKA